MPPADIDRGATARREDERLLRGQGQFVARQSLPGMLHVAFVRSLVPHGRIVAVDLEALRAAPGVVAAYGPEDFAGLPWPRVNPLLPAMRLPAGGPFDEGLVRAVGAPLALVVAESAELARAAAEQAQVEIEEREPVPDFAGDDAPTLHAAVPGNRVVQVRHRVGVLPSAAADAEQSVALPRVAATPLEPRASLMHWLPDQRLEAWIATQTPARAAEELAAVLGVPVAQVRVRAVDVGGAFGGKASLHPEDLMLARAAQRLGRPLRWLATRAEDLLSASHGRASRLQGRLWLDAAGRLQALQAREQFSLGHWLTFSTAAPIQNASRILPGPYRLPALDVEAEARLSSAPAVGIYRGAGRPEACILMERLLDAAARRRGVDPLALRLGNVWQADELPRTLGHGVWLDRADLPALLQRCAQRFDYAGRRERQQREREQQREQPPKQGGGTPAAWRGIGIGLYVEPCGQGGEAVRLTAQPDGRFLLATGATAQGQGRETAYARIAAQALGCAEQAVTVRHGDTGLCPAGIGALASRSTAIGGSAVLAAARALQQQLAAGAARPCTVELFEKAPHEAWASGCVMVELRVDHETGQPRIDALCWVDDAGHCVDEDLVRGQLVGGLAQGLGQALMERVWHDDAGQLSAGSLMDYALPRADDMPPLDLTSLSTPSAANALGAKGVGEAGCIGVPAALLNAAHDALAPLGELQIDFPLTAQKLWRLIKEKTSP